MEELRDEDIKLVTDSKDLQDVIQTLRREIRQLDALYREEKKQLLRKRQRDLAVKRSMAQERLEKSVHREKADDHSLRNLMAMKSRLVAESKVIQEIKPSSSENDTIVDLNLEKELKETTENLNTLIEVAEEQEAELKATLERLDTAIDNDKRIAETLKVNLDEKMEKLVINPEARHLHRIHVLKANVRKVKRCTTETWDKLAEFLHIYFPDVPVTYSEPNSIRNERNALMTDENDLPQRYVQLSEMIQQLMNAHMSKIDNSYLKISNTWFPAYVKLLLGRGICVQHPQRPDHIRLESYL